MRRPTLLVPAAITLALVLGACTSDADRAAGPSAGPSASPGSPGSPGAATTAAPSSSARPSTTTASTTPEPQPSPTPARTSTPPSATTRTSGPPTGRVTSAPASTAGVIVLNPGHNGGNATHAGYIARQVPAGYGQTKPCDTTGTETNAGYSEHAFNWDVTLRVRRLLEARGLRVVLARPNDIGVGPCVDERAAVGNRPGVLASVTIHADGAPASGHGFHVNQASRRPDGATAATAAASERLGKAIRRALASSSGLTPSTYIGTDGLYYRSDFAALNLARRPATFLELGNMRNAGDADLLSSGSGRQRIAAAVTAGILAYLGR